MTRRKINILEDIDYLFRRGWLTREEAERMIDAVLRDNLQEVINDKS